MVLAEGGDVRPRLWCLITLCLAAPPAAAEARALSLRDAVALAVRHDPALAGARARVQVARGEMLEARGLDDPLLLASAEVERRRQAGVPGDPTSEQAVDAAGGSLSLIQPLPIGGRAGLHLDGGYRRVAFATDDPQLARVASQQYTPGLSLSLEQPLLRGTGVDVARAERTRSRARGDIAGAQHEQLAIATVHAVVQSYWALAHAERQLEIYQGSVTAAREQIERVRANIVVGKLPASATAEIEVALAQREDAALNAAQWLARQEIAIRRLCGLAPGTELAAAQPLPPIDAGRVRLRDEALVLALKSSPELEAARGQIRAAAVELRVVEDERLPRLDLALSGGLVANAPTLGAAADQVTGFSGYSASAQLSFELPILGRTARGARQAAHASLRRGEFAEADVRAQLAEAVAQAVMRRDTARQREQLLAPARKAAELDLASEQAQFESGRGSNFGVLRRQDALASVQLLVLSSRLEWNQATATLDALTGELLARHGVVLTSGGN